MNQRKEFWITTVLTSLTMAGLMSGVISGYKMGFSAEWPRIWGHSFLVAWPCALLLSVTLLPQVRRLASWLSQLGVAA